MLINIILILSLFNFLAGRRDILGCGLVAFSGKSTPDPMKLVILAIANETRGKHSCGIANDNKISWGTGTDDKLITNFLKKHKYSFAETNNVLIHMRHATVGGHEHAHPFGFRTSRDKQIVVNENNKPYQMIGMHNGTIENWEELKKEYALGPWASMDSRTILGAIYKKGDFSVLKKYVGAAALIIHNVQKDEMYVYKGEAFSGKHERSLFYAVTPEGMYFSSEEEPLHFFADKVIPVTGNTVLTVKQGTIVNEEKIHRNRPVRTTAVIKPTNTKIVSDDMRVLRVANAAYLDKGRYCVNGLRLNGRIVIDKEDLSVSDTGYNPTYFLDGIELKDYTTHFKWEKEMKEALKKKSKIDFKKFSEDFNHPACIYPGDSTSVLYTNYEENVYYYKGEIFTGEYLMDYTFDTLSTNKEGKLIPNEFDKLSFMESLYFWSEEFFEYMEQYAHIIPLLDEEDQAVIKEIDAIISTFSAYGVLEDSNG